MYVCTTRWQSLLTAIFPLYDQRTIVQNRKPLNNPHPHPNVSVLATPSHKQNGELWNAEGLSLLELQLLMMITRSTPREVGDRTCKKSRGGPFLLLYGCCSCVRGTELHGLAGQPVGDCETAEVGSRHRCSQREKER